MGNLTKFVDNRCFVPIKEIQLISKEQRDFFNENGYVVLRNCIDTNIIQTLLQDAELMFGSGSTWITAPQLKSKNIENYYNSISQYMTDFNGPSRMFLGFLVKKYAQDNAIKPWHQDGIYWGGSDQRVCAIFTPLTKFTSVNGPLYVIPRSHRLGRLYHWEEPGYNLVCDQSPFHDLVCIEADPGDLVVVHSLTIHSARENISNDIRINLGSHWVNNSSTLLLDDANI